MCHLSWPVYASDNVFLALGATQFTFLREIPIGAAYMTRTAVEAWDQKWIYITSIKFAFIFFFLT